MYGIPQSSQWPTRILWMTLGAFGMFGIIGTGLINPSAKPVERVIPDKQDVRKDTRFSDKKKYEHVKGYQRDSKHREGMKP